jgi:hypothetical protein
MIPNQILTDWFTKYFLPPIDKDVAMIGLVNKLQAIICAQNLDFIYSQYNTLYNIIPLT